MGSQQLGVDLQRLFVLQLRTLFVAQAWRHRWRRYEQEAQLPALRKVAKSVERRAQEGSACNVATKRMMQGESTESLTSPPPSISPRAIFRAILSPRIASFFTCRMIGAAGARLQRAVPAASRLRSCSISTVASGEPGAAEEAAGSRETVQETLRAGLAAEVRFRLGCCVWIGWSH